MTQIMKKLITATFVLAIIFSSVLLSPSCKKDQTSDNSNINSDTTNNNSPSGTTYIEPSTQRTGDAQKGYDFLVNGDYNWSGIPFSMFTGTTSVNELNRTGDNATVPFSYTVVTAKNGVKVTVPNCMTCHASYLNGQFIMGLGNSMTDNTTNTSSTLALSDLLIQVKYGASSPEWDAYSIFSTVSKTVAPYIVTDCKGVNSADRLFAILAAHRDPQSLQWSDTPISEIPNLGVIPTDVPAWWLLKKKNAMFYTALGQGDFARIMMASALLTMEDSSDARYADDHFADVYAYLNTIEAPAYPQSIDQTEADKGKTIFENNCSACHGKYGTDESYPNLLVQANVVGTDSLLAYSYSAFSEYLNWFNNGWFGQAPHGAALVNTGGYVAPPLDGVWATAPYLHNGSVPTLEDLLNSTERPVFWKRTFTDTDYDFTKIGWNYSVETSASSTAVYNTTLSGYGNSGHTFGDKLSSDERTSLIEYLKTL